MELLNSRGRALTYIANHPGCGIKDISEGMFLSTRAVGEALEDLRRARLIYTRKDGQRHYYRVMDIGLAGLLKDLQRFEVDLKVKLVEVRVR